MDTPAKTLAKRDIPQFYLLICLYFLQGIPVGLAFGTVPFLLKSMAKETTFTQLGIFSMATYPYSLKILWSPLVDSVYFKKIGRRRSWIIPIQLVSGVMLFFLGTCISRGKVFNGVDDAFHGRNSGGLHNVNVPFLTWCFGTLVFLCATQDIAVDGWALTILSRDSISYSSTAQTIGLNMGYFLSFTVFIALNSSEFANKYVRNMPLPHGLISLGGYMKTAGALYVLLTLYVIFFTKEVPNSVYDLPITDKVKEKDRELSADKALSPTITNIEYPDHVTIKTENTSSIAYVYRGFLKILKLRSVRTLATIHMVSKFAFQCNEAATNLKLLEKGFKREDLAVTVLIDFPFEIIFGYYVVKWSSANEQKRKLNLSRGNHHKTNRIVKFLVGDGGLLTPWLWGFLGRLTAAMFGNYIVSMFPKDGQISTGYFLLVIIQHLLGSFMSTVQFVAISAFHSKIADPVLGGTYMTLLNTLSNFGGTWPRLMIMSMINYFTVYSCTLENGSVAILNRGSNIQACTTALRGTAKVVTDGYYIANMFCIIIGTLLYFMFIKKKMLFLQTLPIGSWRCT
ncbi:uncharacterized protein GVI51_K06655 [Nakaseomyces glabratus]|uniref:Acetyl-CoA transporter n=2 Tax=Candida glabrata TaxID=5478 RepID=Q6FMM5_CANGA|nr:uncharacterized protein CAGL0K06809g [Nakaseomyces glabratus]KAH7582292.1 Acetyl-coenzyme A transporter 1 [Nakaseomyces glabratus]KAH7583200.1 Acetyl-coenzyme A transporter 1 [Nakaseomyces glabratus]KAH7584623.1 Acetyl-coenzyme A transporter 1 [Nakaseomyces glabratus]KAH7597081.1 Acetyl-coenzyme A transporter 1 [Nakaseomyces glabratus]KAH7602853.1 Acetyl-coenzyme A transporter 1 [Nakaseomyces glabratus]|eukprot:XP_448519.1 uncharacterized protein CAGL0K06809g [[Candida] glabrata]